MHYCASSKQLVSPRQLKRVLKINSLKIMESLKILDADHLQPLRRALTNCLVTLVAEYTYAQILDGQPTHSVYAADHYWEKDWPIVDHEEICPGFLHEVKALGSDFDVQSLNFEAQVGHRKTAP